MAASPRLVPRPPLRACLFALALLAPAAGTARAARFTVGGTSDTLVVSPGQTFAVDLVLRDAAPAFNAFDLDVRFNPAQLTNVPMSPLGAQRGELLLNACTANAPFHIFKATPDSLVCTMVILCGDVSVTGPGTLYHLRFTAANEDAYTWITLGPGTTLYMGGPRVDTLVARQIVVRIGTPVLDAGGPPRPPAAAGIAAVAPNPARAPRSLAVRVRMPREDVAEIALLDAQGRRVAGTPRTRLAAGERSIGLALPALAPGRYLVVLRTGGGDVSSRPLVVLR